MKSILNKFDEYVLVIDDNGKIIFANYKLLKKLKYEEEELYKLNIGDILVEKEDFKINILETSKDIKIDLGLYSKYKEVIQVYSDISVDYFERNKSIFIICKDIKYKYYTIEDLENLLDNSGMMSFIKDRNLRYLYVNKVFADAAHMNKEDMIGIRMQDYLEEDLIKQYKDSDSKVLESQQNKSYNEKSIINGEETWYDIYKSPIYDENEEFKYMACTLRDTTLETVIKNELYNNYNHITSLKNLEVDNLVTTDMYDLLESIGKKIINGTCASGFSVLLYDEEKQCLVPYIKLRDGVNAFENIDIIPVRNDVEYENMISGKYEGLKLVHTSSMRYDINKEYLASIAYIGAYRIKLYDEFIGILNIYYKDECTPVHNQDDFMKSICNSIAMIIKNCRLSEEIKIENEKRKSTEQELELYLSTAADLVSIFNEDGYFIKVNSTWTRLLGWSEVELLNHMYTDFLHPDDTGKCIDKNEMVDYANKFINRYRHKNGSYVWLDWNFKYDEEKNIVIGTAKDITDQKSIEEQKKKLEEKVHLESIKNEFFANISHEFKTPINIILGATQLTKKNIDNDNLRVENLIKYTDIIKQNSYRLLRLVNNLIDISRIDIGYYNLQLSNHNIINIIEEITLSVVDYVEGKNINLVFDTDIEEVITSCDPDKIERVILNLLSNAIKYTPENGTIEVNITSDIENINISVKDSGVGIPSDKLDIIFDRFRQANNLLTRRCEGSGIGLSLVKAIVEMHGGKINVYSDIEKGTEFIFNIPIKLLDKDEECVLNYNIKDFHIEKCNIEFSDIYNI